MRVLLVFPNSPIISEPCCEGYNPAKLLPYELIHSAGNLSGFDVRIVDAKASDISLRELELRMRAFNPRVVVLWSTPYSLLGDLQVLRVAKKSDALTVLAMNPPILLKQLIERFDFVDVALGDDKPFVLRRVVERVEAGRGLSNVKGIAFRRKNRAVEREQRFWNYGELPMPAFELAPMERYNKATALIISSRGCPFRCTFCFWGRSRWRGKNPEQTVAEVEVLLKKYGFRRVGFLDQHFTLNREYVYGFLREIKRKRLKFGWFCDSRVDAVESGFFAELHRSGLQRVVLGVEHVNEGILANVKKDQTKEGAERAVAIAKKVGVRPVTPLILGLPGETWETVSELLEFIVKSKPWSYNVFPPIPLPGTELFEQAKRNGWLLVEEKPENFWAKSDFSRPLMAVPPMTPRDLVNARRRLQLLPRLHPTIFFNTVRDLYLKGGFSKLAQLGSAAINSAFGRQVVK